MQFNTENISSLILNYVPKVILAIAVLVIGFWLANKLSNLLRSQLEKSKVDASIIPFASSLISTLLKVMVFISAASMVGVQTTSFIAILSAAVFALGLALQGSLGHFASGILILFFKPYKVGDLIKIGEHVGEVQEIQVFTTVLVNLENKKIIIPNGTVTSEAIINISGQGTIRVDQQFICSNDVDFKEIKKIIKEVADANPKVLKDPEVEIHLNGSNLGITRFDVFPWCKSEDYWEVYYAMQEDIRTAFDKKGINMPDLQMEYSIN